MKDVHETERYATIEDFPDYLITSQGRVFSLKGGNMKELKVGKHKDGYCQIRLWKNGKRPSLLIHRLVAQAFIPNPENKTEVNHIDEDKSNNHVSNLEWVTHKENVNHGTHNERVSKTNTGKKRSEETKAKMSKSKKGSNNPLSKSVIGFKVNGCEIKYYKYMRECENDGFQHSAISKCCKGKQKKHKNFVWYYADEFFNKNK